MKKLVAGVTLSLILAGCSQAGPGGQPVAPEPGSQSEAELKAEFSQFAEALEKGGSISCVMTEEVGSTIQYQVKGDKVRAMTTVETDETSQMMAMISDGEYMYSWDPNKKEGVKFPVLDPEELEEGSEAAPDQPDVPDFSDEETYQEWEESGIAIDCEPANVPDSSFVPPTDVEFTDMSAMMEAAQGMMQDPEGFDEEKFNAELKKMMEEK